MKLVDANEVKNIIKDVIGQSASHTFINTVCGIVDAESKDQASLKTACIKIEKMVGLFIGAGHAQILGKRFSQVLN